LQNKVVVVGLASHQHEMQAKTLAATLW
jgi:hypothetical protein